MTDTITLRKLAEAATQGPWIAGEWATKDEDGALIHCGIQVLATTSANLVSTFAMEGDDEQDVHYIAAANPTAIIALLDEIDSLRAALAQQAEQVNIQRYEPEIFREDWIKMEPDVEGDWVKFSDVCAMRAASQKETK